MAAQAAASANSYQQQPSTAQSPPVSSHPSLIHWVMMACLSLSLPPLLTLVLHAPLELDDDGLAGQLVEERLRVDRRRLLCGVVVVVDGFGSDAAWKMGGAARTEVAAAVHAKAAATRSTQQRAAARSGGAGAQKRHARRFSYSSPLLSPLPWCYRCRCCYLIYMLMFSTTP